MGGGFIPFRLDVNYFDCKQTSILPLLTRLSFTKASNYWGNKFRFGLFEICQDDFNIIAEAMHWSHV